MSAKENIKETLEYHITKLEKRIADIYTVNSPEGYLQTTGKINLLDEIEKLEVYESIYSVFDNDSIKISTTSNEYYDYLKKVREGLELLKAELARVDQENSVEIDNILLILNRFKQEREKFN